MSGNNTIEPAYQNEDAEGHGLIPTVEHKLWPSCFPEPSLRRPIIHQPTT
jgi:hypothetical protein